MRQKVDTVGPILPCRVGARTLARTTDTAADARYYLYDGLGSVVGEVDVNGNVTSAKKFDVYGAARASTGTAKSRQGWVGGLGHQTDPETGYTYMRARYYDPVVGRFVSQDPKGDGINWYWYANDDPVNGFDKDGRTTQKQLDWMVNVYANFGCGFIATGVGAILVAAIAFYTPIGGPAGIIGSAEIIGLTAGVVLFALGIELLQLSWLMNGMTADEFDEGGGVAGLIGKQRAAIEDAIIKTLTPNYDKCGLECG